VGLELGLGGDEVGLELGLPRERGARRHRARSSAAALAGEWLLASGVVWGEGRRRSCGLMCFSHSYWCGAGSTLCSGVWWDGSGLVWTLVSGDRCFKDQQQTCSHVEKRVLASCMGHCW
jgi:hypothetical protein